jgi:hypothetical protein
MHCIACSTARCLLQHALFAAALHSSIVAHTIQSQHSIADATRQPPFNYVASEAQAVLQQPPSAQTSHKKCLCYITRCVYAQLEDLK